MTSPARRHFQRATAAKQAARATATKPQNGDQYELMSAALWEARRTLKNIKSVAAKVEKKRELLPQFEPYIQGVLSAGNGAQDNVLVTCMAWYLDTQNLKAGLDIAEYAINHGLDTPDQYQRDTASLVTEQVAEEALAILEEDNVDIDELLATLHRTYAITEQADMHDPIRAKLHKAIGYAWRAKGEPHAAVENLKKALEYNGRAGVKKDIEKLERDIKNAESQANA